MTEARPHAACPGEADLLQLLDGELSPARAAAVRDHVHACWSCRARYEELKAAIGAFVDLVEGPVHAAIPPPPLQWAGFRTLLRAAVAERRSRPDKARSGRSARSARSAAASITRPLRAVLAGMLASASARRLVTSGVLAALAGLFITFVPASPRLSAQVILDHAIASDSRHVAHLERPVTRQRLEARRRVNGRIVERARWELYHDVRFGRARVYPTTAAPPLAAEIMRLFDAHQWDIRGPLSSAGYNRWQRSTGGASTDYTRLTLDDGRAAYRVRARMPEPVRAGAIASAGLVVRADDWHAVRQDIEVRTATGYDDIQITEIDFDVLRFDRVAAGIFTDDGPAHPAPAAPRLLSEAELDALEMSVRYTLHGHGADRGEPIQIVRGQSRLTVGGLVDSTTRAVELSAALARIPHVRVDLTALDRVDPRAVAPGAGPAAGAAVVYVDRSSEPPLQAVIDALITAGSSGAGPDATGRPDVADSSGDARASLASRRNAFVARALAAADRAMAEAWALRRLGDRYPREAVAGLADRAGDLLEEMVRDHVRGLIVSTSAWRAELGALAPFARARLAGAAASGGIQATGSTSALGQGAGEPSRTGPASGIEPWPAYTATVFRTLVQAQSTTTDGLVGGAHAAAAATAQPAAATAQPDAAAAARHEAERRLLDLLDDLAALEQTLRRLDDEARQGRRLTDMASASAVSRLGSPVAPPLGPPLGPPPGPPR